MSIDTALTTAVSSLRANQESLTIISQNIANANSENYTRRIGTRKSEIVDGQVAGVKIAEIRRAVDEFLVSAARNQISDVGKTTALSDYLNKIQDYFGQPGAGNSLNSAVNSFFAELGNLAVTPDQSTRNRALLQANKLAEKISGLAYNMEKTRFEIDQEIKKTVTEVNSLIDKLQNVNKALREVSVRHGDSTPLLDERDGLLSKLSSIVDVNVSFLETGEVTITLSKGDILSPTQKTRLDYNTVPNVDALINGDIIGAISVIYLDQDGNDTTSKFEILSASNAVTREIGFSSGKLKALIDLRDTDIPKILEQLDEFADSFKNSFNAIHNDGAGFPPPEALTGTRTTFAAQEFYFSGKARIAILNPDGTPVLDRFDTNTTYPPLTINFDKLDGGNGQGAVTVQSIINEINNYYGPPPSKIVSLGKLNDIRLAAVSSNISSTESTGTLTFNGNPGVGDTITVNGVTYTFVATGTASNGTNIERKSSAADTVAEVSRYLNTRTGATAVATYSSAGSTLTITHDTAGIAGDTYAFSANFGISGLGATASVNGGAFGATPSGTLQGGADANGTFEFDFEFSNIAGDAAIFEVLDISVDNGAAGLVGTLPTDFDAYTAQPGERVRTGTDGVDNDTITIDFTGSNQGEGGTHTVSAQIRVTDPDGTVYTDTIDFLITIPDPNTNIINQRFNTTGTTTGGGSEVENVTNNNRYATAMLVDADGNEITDGSEGFLKIRTDYGDYGIVIDELNSKEEGETSNAVNTKTGRAFSHFFGLNDFFESGNTLADSAYNFKIRDEYKSNSGRLAAGELVLSPQSFDPDADPVYTYEMGIGSDQLASRLAALATDRMTFDSAGSLPSMTTTLGGYSAEITSYAANAASGADESKRQSEILYNAFNDKIKEVGGVNIDEELANTLQFQNNYAASARMINVISELFQKLIDAF